MTNDIEVQRGTVDVPRAGATSAPGTSFGSLTSAFVLNKCNRFGNSGPSATGSSTYYADDLSGRIELTGTNQITFTRITTSNNANHRMDWESWEYKGPSGGDNEFIVRSRNTVTLTSGTRSTTATLDTTPNSINKCIPFITGISNTDTDVNSNGLTAIVWISGSNTLNIERGGATGTTIVQVVTVEFTGSNWTVGHSYVSETTADSGTATLYQNADGQTTSLTLSSTGTSFVASHGSRGDTNDTDEAIADNWPTSYISSTTQISWDYNSQHAVTNGNKQFFHVLEHPDIVVTRFTDTGSSAGDNTDDITSAGLSNLTYSSVFATTNSSGTGTAFPRGWKQYKLESLTSVNAWCYRSGNTISTRFEIVDLIDVQSEAYIPQIIAMVI